MGETNFTPGPWDVDGKEIIGRKGRKIISDYGSYEGLAWGGGDKAISEAEVEASKLLIAAAPELYVTLEQAREVLAAGPSETEVKASGILERCDAILAQARGETQA